MRFREILKETKFPAEDFIKYLKDNYNQLFDYFNIDASTLRLVDIKIKKTPTIDTLISYISILKEEAQKFNIVLSINVNNKEIKNELRHLGFTYPMTDYSDLVWTPQ